MFGCCADESVHHGIFLVLVNLVDSLLDCLGYVSARRVGMKETIVLAGSHAGLVPVVEWAQYKYPGNMTTKTPSLCLAWKHVFHCGVVAVAVLESISE